MKKNLRSAILILGGLISLLGLGILFGLLDAGIISFTSQFIGKNSGPKWPGYIHLGGTVILIFGIAIILFREILHAGAKLTHFAKSLSTQTDRWMEKKLENQAKLSGSRPFEWPVKFTFPDWALIIFFLALSFIYQIAMSGNGFPTVVLGGDAANIASFAAARAYPNLFATDAILGDLQNIGLYTTIHLPVTIFLAKLLGNFGLAYKVLLFPHVFFQYFGYYLLGRVLFKNRYWAFLFTMAISSPLDLAGGEMWGITSEGMPRFTYQVILPFIFIIFLALWKGRPERWPWLMTLTGLLVFIHPVSTPTWAVAFWAGLWPNMPASYNIRKKLLEMFKMGVILVLALLPYIIIYLSYKQGGQAKSNYDLVYHILINYFPNDLLNIPAAVQTLIEVSSKYGLFWFGLAGLLTTYFLFKTERKFLAQMLTWVIGIVFITILVPYIEQNIERALRIIPLQTEVMRGMRYLIIFLFIFWFYPLAELTHRLKNPIWIKAVFLVGTIMSVFWLVKNPPYPIREVPNVVQCWSQGTLICPTNTDYAAALEFIKNDTPEQARFVVFLTSRWSGIEVRYLGLRPMAYAYKDKGQLAFTNLSALENWFYFLNRENAIFSKNNSPTLELKQKRMVDFAFDAEANFMLTDFPFPKEVQEQYDISTVYQNNTYSVIKIYDTRK